MTLIVYCYHHHDIPALYRSLIISPLLGEVQVQPNSTQTDQSSDPESAGSVL